LINGTGAWAEDDPGGKHGVLLGAEDMWDFLQGRNTAPYTTELTHVLCGVPFNEFFSTSLVHELTHLFVAAGPSPPWDTEDREHLRWPSGAEHSGKLTSFEYTALMADGMDRHCHLLATVRFFPHTKEQMDLRGTHPYQ